MRGRIRVVRASLLIACLATAAGAEEQRPFCTTPLDRTALFASDASKDLYNSLLWFTGVGVVHFSTQAPGRWSRKNDFDTGIRDGLRASDSGSRRAAGYGSDALLGISAGLMPLAAIGRTLHERDCVQAWDMATDALESIGLTVFVTESVKVIAGRERPYVRSCGRPNQPSDAKCGNRDRFKSFFSGHASLAAAGAGLSCSFAIRRQTWGSSTMAQALPCALGAAAAFGTGLLRVVADRHFGSDVLVGFAVGGLIGYFDTWGPFDLLSFEVEPAGSARSIQGIVLPYAGAGQVGARIALRF